MVYFIPRFTGLIVKYYDFWAFLFSSYREFSLTDSVLRVIPLLSYGFCQLSVAKLDLKESVKKSWIEAKHDLPTLSKPWVSSCASTIPIAPKLTALKHQFRKQFRKTYKMQLSLIKISIIYVKKLLHFDWSKAVQSLCNFTVQKCACNSRR